MLTMALQLLRLLKQQKQVPSQDDIHKVVPPGEFALE